MAAEEPGVVGHHEAIAWLMDRVGAEVAVSVTIDLGYDAELMRFHGELAHWTTPDDLSDLVPGALRLGAREDLMGWFIIGAAGRLDLSDLAEVATYDVAVLDGRGDIGLRVELPDRVSVCVRDYVGATEPVEAIADEGEDS
jgi:hypothetical protein